MKMIWTRKIKKSRIRKGKNRKKRTENMKLYESLDFIYREGRGWEIGNGG